MRIKRLVAVLLAIVMLFGVFTANITSVSAATTYATVREGSKNDDVKTLQKMLNTVSNAKLDVDGSFGPGTLAAVKAFQKANGLDADGVVGPATWEVLTKQYQKKTSNITIGSGNYNPGTYMVGESYSISGVVSSNYELTSVTVGVYKENGTATSYVKTVDPNAKNYNISKADSSIKFGALAAGTYKFKVVAKDSTGNSKTLVNNTFKVNAKSTLAIGSGKYNPGTITKGKSYSISGVISSNYNITSVVIGIYKSNGTATSYVKTVKPNAKSYNISNVNDAMKFSALAVGSYKFKVVAKDASGASKTLVNNTVTVKKATSASKLDTFKSNALATWVTPVRVKYLTVKGTGRAFGASRSNGTRAHAGMDYYVRGGNGVPVYAMQSGVVIEYVGAFYAGTSSVAVRHADGSVARYAEISSSLRVGDKVKRNQKIGKIKKNTKDGGTMLHLELYLGTVSGKLTNRSNTKYYYVSGTKYQKRADLVNPEFLLSLTRTK